MFPDSSIPATKNSLDLRSLPPADRSPRVLELFDALKPGEAFVLLTDEDPHPLLKKLGGERPDDLTWSPLEEGPSCWRMALSRSDLPGPRGRSLSEYLAWDHDRLEALLEAAVAAVHSGDPEAAAGRFGEFSTGLKRHIRMEEGVLFPAFEQSTGLGQDGPTAVMRQEHRQIEGLLGEIGTLLARGRLAPGDFYSLHGALLAVLGAHNAKEEQIVYPLTDQTHAATEREDLFHRMQSI